ncbi:hypothetical protein P5V15_011478 [Pogonomyrmex californicus]
MSSKMPSDLRMPYLQAIQKIPGDTAGEKLSWIGRSALKQTEKDLELLPPELLPILRVEAAVKKKNHSEDIASALKCEDSTIINRALKASWFFDGSHKEILDVTYFCKQLFPYVSLNTRTRIIAELTHRLSGKDPVFAHDLFIEVESIYGLRTAYPLIVACDEAFVYKTIVEKELVLPTGIVKKIFRKNPDLVVRFLKLLKPCESDTAERSPFAIGIDRYKTFLPKLIKKHLDAFIELCEIHETHLPNISLSKTCTEIFRTKATQHLLEKPLTYIHMLPLGQINDLMERIFPKLLPEKMSSFDTDSALKYLEHYPLTERYDLLRKTYENKYNADLLDQTKNVTPALLRLLPTEERIKEARIKIEKENLEKFHFEGKIYYEDTMNYETAWICYLPTDEAIPAIKEKINKSSYETDRAGLICQMIYTCKINEDFQALFDTLMYFLNRHRNESNWVFQKMFSILLQLYDVAFQFDEKLMSLTWEIARIPYIKEEYVLYDILEAIIHFRLKFNKPIIELLDMFIKQNIFNILQKYPVHERQCLLTFADIIKDKYSNDKDLLCQFVTSIYDFNERCKKSRINIKQIRITDYPWLENFLFEELTSCRQSYCDVKDILQKYEPELYHTWFPGSIVNIKSGEALRLLKRDSQKILNIWEKYLDNCKENCNYIKVQRFVRHLRWYKDLPIKFVENCLSNYSINTNEKSKNIPILAILLHGDMVTKLIDPLIPTETTVDTNHPDAKDNYQLVNYLPLSMRLSNPPVPLNLVAKLCVGDYLSVALKTLINVSRRTCVPEVISTAQKLMNMRVSTRKHGIRLMYLVASMRELKSFLQNTWATETHHSVRQVLFNTIQKFFLMNPNPETWSLYYQTTLTMNLDDEALLSEMKLFSDIPNEYIVKYLNLWFKAINNLHEMGMDVQKTNKYIANCLETLTISISNLLPEEFTENILQKFLFHSNTDVSNAARCFTISYIFSEDKDTHTARFKIFADIFHKAVTISWNVSHPKKLRFYPVNNAVRLFIDDFVSNYVNKSCLKNSTNPNIIDNMQTIFSSVLSPEQDAKSYLLLVYAKKFQECTLTKESFGLKLGQQLHELIDVFSLLSVSFIAQVLEYFLDIVFGSVYIDFEEVKFSVLEGLVEAGNSNSCFMAATMLPWRILSQHIAKYDRLIEKLREMHHEPAVTAVLYKHLNETDLEIID